MVFDARPRRSFLQIHVMGTLSSLRSLGIAASAAVVVTLALPSLATGAGTAGLVLRTTRAAPGGGTTPSLLRDASGFTITRDPIGPARWDAFDAQMRTFMRENGIRAGQLAVAKAGTIVYSHAYTNATDPSYTITQPTSIMRVSSNSKALVTAAITKLYATGTISPSTLAYPYLGVKKPLLASQKPDPRSNEITVDELVNHTAGLPNSSGASPEFNMWTIERQARIDGPLSAAQFAAYLYGVPLTSNPGTTEVYSNDGYFLLQRIVEKATGEDYLTWVDANVLAPIGIDDAVVTHTAADRRRPNETTCDDPNTGPSVLEPVRAPIVPDCYGGISVYEILGGPTSISISAQSLAKFIGTYNVYGLGGRAPGYAREGSFVGSTSWMESLYDGYDFAFSFNARENRQQQYFDISSLTTYFESHIK
jgi:CubicO group peptidase (beta-lactamase class C family)